MAEAVTISLGVRLHGPWILDPPAIDRRGRSILVGNYARPRWSLGIALNDIGVATAMDADYWQAAHPPTRLVLGGSIRPVHNPWAGIILSGSLAHWYHDVQEGEAAVGGADFKFSTWRVGLGTEIAGMVEAGIAIGGGYDDGDRRASLYFAMGPPFLKLNIQAFSDQLAVEGYGGYRQWEEDFNRIALNISWPFRYYRNEPEPEHPSIY